MISLKTLLTENSYAYGCVMAEIPKDTAENIIKFGQQIIPDEILYHDPTGKEEFGRETDMHVTIKFGLMQSYTQEQMTQFLSTAQPFYITIKGLSVFKNPAFDVVKFDIDGDETLHRLRAKFDSLPNADEHKEYHPHMTLAYVKPGMGKKFTQIRGKGFSRVLISRIKYSDKGNRKFYFAL